MKHATVKKSLAAILAGIGALNCTSVAIVTWISVAPYQPMWPFPALVLIETTLLGILGLIAYIQSRPWSQITRWVIPGCLFTIVVLGAWSIGFFLLPAALAFLISAFVMGSESPLNWYAKFGFLTAGILFNLLFILSGRLF